MKQLSLQRWDDVRVFLAVAQSRSLSDAAKRLTTDQSTISRRLTSLEEELGVMLIERTPQGCFLTPVGERVLGEAKQLELQVHRFCDAVSVEDPRVVGKVRIALTEGLAIHFVLPSIMPSFQERHPELRIELITSTVPADLARHEADIALRFYRDSSGDLTVKKLGRMHRHVLVHRSRLTSLAKTKIPDLPWISGTLDGLEGPWLRSIGVQALSLSITSYEAQLAAIRAGLGAGLQPTVLTQLYPELVVLPQCPEAPPLELFMVTRSTIRQTPRIRAVCSLLSEGFKELFRRDAETPLKQPRGA